MTWDAVALAHVGDDHRLTLRSVRELRCHSCAVTLVLPKPPDTETPTPPPFQRPPRDDIRPMPAGFRERVAAELAARRASRQAAATEEDA